MRDTSFKNSSSLKAATEIKSKSFKVKRTIFLCGKSSRILSNSSQSKYVNKKNDLSVRKWQLSLHRHYKSCGEAHGKERLKTKEESLKVTLENRPDRRRWTAVCDSHSDSKADGRCHQASKAAVYSCSPASYDGTVPCRHLCTRTATLNWIFSGTFSQCIWRMSRVMLLHPDEEFGTDWSCWRRYDGMPARVAFP